jgi:hypothetical protein
VKRGHLTLTIGGLVAFASRQHHQRIDHADVFRFASVYRYFFAVMFLFFVGCGFYSLATIRPSPAARVEWLISMIICTFFCSGALFGLAWSMRFSIAVSEASVLVQGIFKPRKFDLTDVHSITVLNGFRGAKDLRVYDSAGRVLVAVGGTIEDFQELVGLLRRKASGRNVLVRERDGAGQWQERAP